MCCLKNVKNTHGGVIILVKLQAKTSSMGVFHNFLIVQVVPSHTKCYTKRHICHIANDKIPNYLQWGQSGISIVTLCKSYTFPAGMYMFRVKTKTTRFICWMCSKWTIMTAERHHWRQSYVFIDKFERIFALWVVSCQFFWLNLKWYWWLRR